MSYQNDEETEILHVSNVPAKSTASSASLIFGGVVAIGFVGLLVINSQSGNKINSNLQMKVEGGYYSSMTSSEHSSLFEDFKANFNREYKMTEENERYENFKAFLILIDERNAAEAAADNTATHGITKFADRSAEELSRLNGFKVDDIDAAKARGKKGDDLDLDMDEEMKATLSVNWAGTYTTPVKDQGYCGSCWAFSATEQLESDSIRAGYTTTSEPLSTQQVVSCDTYDYGCDGGITVYAYYYVYKTGGLESNSSYPYDSYMGTDTTCESAKKDYLISTTEFYYLESETTMETHVLNVGPLSVCLDASTWHSYTNGTLSTCGDTVDHCVQAVGINMVEGYWTIRNSWGTDWGVDGYIYLKAGENLCDIDYIPTYTVVETVDYDDD